MDPDEPNSACENLCKKRIRVIDNIQSLFKNANGLQVEAAAELKEACRPQTVR